MYGADILCDSISPNGVRLITIAATFPRIVLAEQNTHRVFSRNTASSRAIPVETRCAAIEANPFVPEAFGKNKRGMQADELLDPEANAEAEAIWREALADALRHARRLAKIGVHKQYANRLTEPFAWVTQIVTATQWDNYMNLRCHRAAQPEIKVVAELMRAAIAKSTPTKCFVGDWHLPLIAEEDIDAAYGKVHTEGVDHLLAKLSVARCAAVSYEKHGVKKTIEEDLARHDMLRASGHMSPFEHQAYVGAEGLLAYSGNFAPPWVQYRKTLANEEVFPKEEE
jgi:thymidylate synthase ThyX